MLNIFAQYRDLIDFNFKDNDGYACFEKHVENQGHDEAASFAEHLASKPAEST